MSEEATVKAVIDFGHFLGVFLIVGGGVVVGLAVVVLRQMVGGAAWRRVTCTRWRSAWWKEMGSEAGIPRVDKRKCPRGQPARAPVDRALALQQGEG